MIIMSLYEYLTEEDKGLIEYYIRQYALNDGYYYGDVNLTTSLRYWATDKQKLYQLLGENFIIEKPIRFVASTEQLTADIEKANVDKMPFIQKLSAAIAAEAKKEKVNWCLPTWYLAIQSMTSAQSLVKNAWDGEPFKFQFKEHTIIVQSKEKITKIFKTFAKILGLEQDYEDFRLKHSQVLNQKKLNGTLCLSIHPLDFFSLSDNGIGWKSCMSWCNKGDYREGTLECLNSSAIVVAYLKDKSDWCFDSCHKWNNKKWRELFVVTDQVICGIKGYPYANDNLECEIVNWLRDLAVDNLGWEYSKELLPQKTFNGEWDYNGKYYNGVFCFDYMYNDFLTYNVYHYAHFSATLPPDVSFSCDISAPVRCILCGDYLDGSGYQENGLGVVVCDDCDSSVQHCSCCQGRIGLDEINWLDDDVYCESCFDRYAYWCPLEEEYHSEGQLVEVFLVEDDTMLETYYDFRTLPLINISEYVANRLQDNIDEEFEVNEVREFQDPQFPYVRKYYLYKSDVPKKYLNAWDY